MIRRMSLSPGARLGPYEISGPLGAGGMGQVYAARDMRLGRDVAIKVLSANLAGNAEAKERFEREARAIAALNHPRICTLHDVGEHDGVAYLVMERVDGETLAKRLERGPMKLDEALRTAVGVAEALAAAHARGIVHRDLKPGNVMLARTGVKILDFGIAKLREESGEIGGAGGLASDLTRTTPLTSAGAVMGTMQYMAPEQLEGKPVDHRADLFSFGALLYEALTGKRAFDGGSQASVIAAILEREPRPISELLPSAPPAVDRIVKVCLAKDPDERWQSAKDLARELHWIVEGRVDAVALPADRSARSRMGLGLAAALAAGGVIVGAGSMLLLRGAPVPAPLPTIRASIELPPGIHLDPFDSPLAASPDGRSLVITGVTPEGKSSLLVRDLDAAECRALPGTDGAAYPFWSPDGASIGFFADRKLKRVVARGGAVQNLADATAGRGGTWLADGTIVYAPAPAGPLQRIAGTGGTPEAVTETTRDQETHRVPHVMPDGKHVLYVAGVGTDTKTYRVLRLDPVARRSEPLGASDAEAYWCEPGWLAFVRDGNLVAQKMDPATLRAIGDAQPLAEGVWTMAARRTAHFTVAGPGLLAYAARGVMESRMALRDEAGTLLSMQGERVFVNGVRLSPDAKHAGVSAIGSDGQLNLWVLDLTRGVSTRFTVGDRHGYSPVWSPDLRTIYYGGVNGEILSRDADGRTEPQVLLGPHILNRAPLSVSPDGARLVLAEQNVGTAFDLFVLPLGPGGKPAPLVATAANENEARVSPDGRSMLYVSDESGRDEVYVVPFPSGAGKWQVSSAGGSLGWWIDGGRRLAFLQPSDNRVLAVDVTPRAGGLEFGEPKPLFGGKPVPSTILDVTSDGKRWLVAMPDDDPKERVTVDLVTNWTSALKRD